MCGRFVLSSTPHDLARYFAAVPSADLVTEAELGVSGPEYNVAPTAAIYLVRQHHQERWLGRARWGLVPPWSKDAAGAARMINARAETLAAKPSFRSAFGQRRCLIPADGFYEWTTVAGHKKRQPWFVHRPDGEPYAFAGLWERWRDPARRDDDHPDPDPDPDPDRGWLRTCCIITAAANPVMAQLHDRMPVVLPPAHWEQWLDPAQRDPELLSELLQPTPASLVAFHPVSVQVNSARTQGPDLINPIELLDPDGVGQQRSLFDPVDPLGASTGRGDGSFA
ncbi:MAG: SOS response-associated peptidase [Acidimicrobiales bacterium]